ncbi:hypothetical protein H634G_09708 [Metarhizium anisopliae BRIP 53293]|uniref:CTLH domain-containing protein n=1 Tax=Metarhizium anisopliae BRIP 53293 TaxID=1291518 RepID=A0A0D9NMV4_METAN|nr:hypothetical protein H634G_09708 [Metarhizium anisopliae BRIP 53293]
MSPSRGPHFMARSNSVFQSPVDAAWAFSLQHLKRRRRRFRLPVPLFAISRTSGPLWPSTGNQLQRSLPSLKPHVINDPVSRDICLDPLLTSLLHDRLLMPPKPTKLVASTFSSAAQPFQTATRPDAYSILAFILIGADPIQNRPKLPPRPARGTVDVDQPSDARSLHPIVSSDDPSTPPTSRPSASTVRPAPNPSSPLDRPGRSAQLAPASNANIESSTPRPDLPSGSVSQVLGRRRRPSGSSPTQDPNDPASADNEAAPAGTHSSPSRRLPKRRRREGEDMASDGNSVLQSNGSGAARSNGSTGVASQRTVLPSGATNGTHKAASLAANGSANGDKASTSAVRPSSYFGHNREEVTRILIQALSDMGYQAAAESVSEESGFKLENPTVAAFRSAVLEGSWAEAEDLLTEAIVAGQAGEDGGGGNGLVLAPGSERNVMRFAMRQQKFLELLETRDTTRALQVLRGELTPLDHDTVKVHFLSSLLMCLSTEDLMAKANWDGAGGQSRKRLLSDLSRCISPSVMLPENRLAVLLHQVKQSQINSCLFHTAASSPSLYADHHCDRRVFPRDIVLELTEMRGEVWEVQFSHDGTQLAACGSSDSVFIWETWSFQVVHALSMQVQKDHHSGVASIAWSPDDSMMVTCSQDHFARLWDTKNGQLIKKLKRFDEPVSSCIWASDSKSFVLGTLDNKRSICTFNSEGEELVQWDKKHRVQAMAGSPDGRWLVAADNFTNMYVYNGITRALEYELDLGAQPISLAISQDSRQLLVNKGDSEAQLIDLFTRATVQKFLGHMTDQCVIRASFGGANESFVMSGSEDGKVVIWHKNIGAAVERLSSFSGKRCNCVVWNPADSYMLASCNDDGKVRIWANRKRGVDIRSRIPGLTGWKHHQNEPVPF